jgi:2-methylisocitrate lyase-like PEP mutase family enzyme/pimeloyl-ACP methyl ester carboxylesterase
MPSIQIPSGRIHYREQGKGPVALFVHGVLLNGYLWRHQLEHLADIRRCIAVDLLAHGDTEIAPDQDVSVTANATMLTEFLDALGIDQVDLVGNDSGGGIAQIFAACNPQRIRSLTLTDCDAYDNWPPEAFKPFLAMAAAGGLTDTLGAMLADKTIYRSQGALGPAYEHPELVSDASIETYLRPLVRTEQRTRDFQRFLGAFDNAHTRAVEARLGQLKAPTLIVWGTDDIYFDVMWSRRLAETIPGTRRRVELTGARIFFPEERWAEFNAELRAHWRAADQGRRADRFRALHVRGEPLVLFNVWDVGSTKAVAAGGAEAIATSSWAVADANGYVDGERLPLVAAIDNLRRIVAATDLPVTVDLESGYDDVARAIALAIEAGAVGCNLEDTVPSNRHLREIAEQSGRIEAARRAADDAGIPFFINARTDVFLHGDGSVDEAIARAQAYAAAGADGLFVPGLSDIDRIAQLAEASPLPLNIMFDDDTTPLAELAARGVARVSYGPRPYLLAMQALRDAYPALHPVG